jgi:iron(III) transport system ATP-binding protein
VSDLAIRDLRKVFGTTVALDDVTITAAEGELLTLLGPSGCGKSTTLWSIAGLHEPDAGTIQVGDEVFFDATTNRPVEDRNCGVVFQSYAVWPHMSVFDNVAYPLKLRRVKSPARRRRVTEMLELVELAPYADRYPHELSGGQQQRVALARALAYEPRLLLLDEPFSNLDAKLRERARDWLRALQRRIGITTVFVTHDQDEALSMSDRIVVMNGGRVLQTGTPEEIYRTPAELFVADFVGSVNVLRGEVVDADGTTASVRVPGVEQLLRIASPLRAIGPVDVAVRPEATIVRGPATGAPPGPNQLAAVVLDRAYLGDHHRSRLDVAGTVIGVPGDAGAPGTSVIVEFPENEAQLFPRAASTMNENKEQIDVLSAR